MITFSSFFLIEVTFADPSIQSVDGQITQNQTVVISGSSFSIKNQATPWIWDNCEDNASFSDAGWTDVRPSGSATEGVNMSYETIYGNIPQPHENSSMYAKGIHYGQSNVLFYTYKPVVVNKFYARWYYYEKYPFTYAPLGVPGDYDLRNNKNFFIQNGSMAYGGGGTGISYAYIDNNWLALYDVNESGKWEQYFSPLNGNVKRTIHTNGFGSTSGKIGRAHV